jgi:phosphatidylethanolamine-binding protein (PEBP) family uncharacterized protein
MSLLGRLLHDRRAGETHTAWNLPNLQAPDQLTLTSQDFGDGEVMPLKQCAKTVGGADLSPQLTWAPLPPSTAQLLLVVEDIDVPIAKPAVHCLALIDPAAAEHLEPGALAARHPGPGVRILRSTIGVTTVPRPSKATARTATSSSCSPSRLPWTAPPPQRPSTGPDPAPSCPRSPHPSSPGAD